MVQLFPGVFEEVFLAAEYTLNPPRKAELALVQLLCFPGEQSAASGEKTLDSFAEGHLRQAGIPIKSGVEPFRSLFDLFPSSGEDLPAPLSHGLFKCFQLFRKAQHPGDEEFRHRRGGFLAGMGHQVDDGLVFLMADARDYRQGELGHRKGQVEMVEAAEIGLGASAPKDGHGVECRFFMKNPVEGVQDGGHGFAPLHKSLEEADFEAEAIGVVFELVREILVSRGGG